MDPPQNDQHLLQNMSELEYNELLLKEILIKDQIEEFEKLAQIRKFINFKLGGRSILAWTVHHESELIFDFLIAQPDLVVDFTESHARTALFLAIYGYCLSTQPDDEFVYEYFIQHLLYKGANNILVNEFGYEPLDTKTTSFDLCIHILLLHRGGSIVHVRDYFVPIHCAAATFCSPQTLRILMALTYDHLEPINIHILTIILLIKCDHVNLLEEMLEQISMIHVPSKRYLPLLLIHLYKVPFSTFKALTQKSSQIMEHLMQIPVLDLRLLIYKHRDVVQYLTFFCESCSHLEAFNANILLSQPQLISYERLFESICMMLGNAVALEIDLDQLYDLYGFSELFELLLRVHIEFVKRADGPCFVPVWYNTRLARPRPLWVHDDFKDQQLYFAGKKQVPKLVQLSRDVYRNSLLQRFEIFDSIRWARTVDDLPILDDFKDILMFKQRIY